MLPGLSRAGTLSGSTTGISSVPKTGRLCAISDNCEYFRNQGNNYSLFMLSQDNVDEPENNPPVTAVRRPGRGHPVCQRLHERSRDKGDIPTSDPSRKSDGNPGCRQ